MTKSKKPKIRKSSKRKPYSKGELNKLIDGLIHPLYKKNGAFIIVDGLMHSMVEQAPGKSVAKFIRYSLPKMLEQIT
jgi:hypothetical protein